MKRIIITSLIMLMAFMQSSAALDVPDYSGRINDYADILSEKETADLENRLADFEKNTTCQIMVLTIPSLEGDTLEEYSIRVAEAWKPGQKGKDNGILLLIALNDRKMRIETGYGLEDKVTDLAAGRIIDNEIAPFFKGGDYYGGISNGLNSIMNTIISGKYNGDSQLSIELTSGTGDNDIDSQVNDIPIPARIAIGIFIFSILGIFTFLMLFQDGFISVFMYFFLIPFWGIFPILAVGLTGDLIIICIYITGIPLAKLYFHKSKNGKKIYKKYGSFFTSAGSSSGSSSFRSSGSSGSSFSSGGGSFGGGGASGSW